MPDDKKSFIKQLVEALEAEVKAGKPAENPAAKIDAPAEPCIEHGLKTLEQAVQDYHQLVALTTKAFHDKRINHTEMATLLCIDGANLGKMWSMLLQHIRAAHSNDVDESRMDAITDEHVKLVMSSVPDRKM